jgi:hypothetical protein
LIINDDDDDNDDNNNKNNKNLYSGYIPSTLTNKYPLLVLFKYIFNILLVCMLWLFFNVLCKFIYIYYASLLLWLQIYHVFIILRDYKLKFYAYWSMYLWILENNLKVLLCCMNVICLVYIYYCILYVVFTLVCLFWLNKFMMVWCMFIWYICDLKLL